MTRLQAYYDVLIEEDAAFRGELETLVCELRPLPAIADDNDAGWQRLKQCAERFALPRQYGAYDLWYSIGLAQTGGPLQLYGFRMFGDPVRKPHEPSGIVVGDGTRLLRSVPEQEAVRNIVPPAWLLPLLAQPITLPDPRLGRSEGARWLIKFLADMWRDSMLGQIDALEKTASWLGYRPRPPKHRSTATLRRNALRLYRRAVLRPVRAWAQIARLEPTTPRTGEHPRWQSVQGSVEEWARILDIPLP